MTELDDYTLESQKLKAEDLFEEVNVLSVQCGLRFNYILLNLNFVYLA